MEVTINLVQLLGIGIGILASFVTAWVIMNSRVKALEVSTEIQFKQIHLDLQNGDKKFDRILAELSDIKVALQDKEDRKK
jgi:hypothetical protein